MDNKANDCGEALKKRVEYTLWRQMGIMSALNKYLFLFEFLEEFFNFLFFFKLEIITLNYSCSL